MTPIARAQIDKIRLDRSKLLLLGGNAVPGLSNRRMVGIKMTNLRPPTAKK